MTGIQHYIVFLYGFSCIYLSPENTQCGLQGKRPFFLQKNFKTTANAKKTGTLGK